MSKERREKLIPYRVFISNPSTSDVWRCTVMMSDRKAQAMRERLVRAEQEGKILHDWFVDAPSSPYSVRDLEDFLDLIKVYPES